MSSRLMDTDLGTVQSISPQVADLRVLQRILNRDLHAYQACVMGIFLWRGGKAVRQKELSRCLLPIRSHDLSYTCKSAPILKGVFSKEEFEKNCEKTRRSCHPSH